MIPEYLRDVASRHGDRLAIVDGSQGITYRELLDRIGWTREWLRTALDPQPGSVIAGAMDNSWQFVACFFAISELGCIFMPCNPQWRGAELRSLALRLRLKGAIVEPRLRAEWDRISDLLPRNRVLTADNAPEAGDDPGDFHGPPAAADATTLYLSTSGSSGAPRLVPRTHRNLIANAENVARSIGVGPGRRFLGVVPLHYAYGFSSSLTLPLFNGATIVVMRKFSPGACIELVREHAIDTLFGSPFLFGSLLDAVRDPALLASLHWCFTGGGRTPANVFERWHTFFNVALRQQYGMTESGVMALEGSASNRLSSAGAHVGKAVHGVDLAVLDSAGRKLYAGETGEIAVQSPAVMAGYFDQPELNSDLFLNGYFRTGDLGHLDAAGNLHLAGRKSGALNIAGVKVDPVEVERAIETIPNVASCHVDAVPNGRGGDVIRARVVPRKGLSVSRKEVIEQCRLQLAEYKLPRVIEFLEDLPLSLAGKIPRQRVADPASPRLDPPGSS